MGRLSRIRADLNKVKEGIWVPWYEGIRLRIARFGNPEFSSFLRKHGKDQKWLAKQGGAVSKDGEELFIRALANHVLLDWENVEDDQDKPIQYTPEIGEKYLSDDLYVELLEFILTVSQDRAAFRQEEIEEGAGKSRNTLPG